MTLIESKCDCGTVLRATQPSTLRCTCGELKKLIPAGDPREHSISYEKNHWYKIHEYFPSLKESWDAETAKRVFDKWCNTIPDACGCQTNFKRLLKKHPVEYKNPLSFAHCLWRLHDSVSQEVGNPRITFDDYLASWWSWPPAKQNRLIVVVATGKCLREYSIVRPLLERYAKRVHADLVCLCNLTESWWGYEKFRVDRMRPYYQRILFVDSDVVITPSCPDLFDLVPRDQVGLHNDFEHLGGNHQWLFDEQDAVCESQHWSYNRLHSCANTGVVVCSKNHPIWKRPVRPLPQMHETEQLHVEYQIHHHSIPWFQLPTEFNTQWWMKDFEKRCKSAAIIHLANCPNKAERLQEFVLKFS